MYPESPYFQKTSSLKQLLKSNNNMLSLFKSFQKELSDIKQKQLYRSLIRLQGVDFISNDYLDFSSHPEIRKKMIKALQTELPLSSKSSRLLGGSTKWHENTENILRNFTANNAALIFSSGFQANVGVIPALSHNKTIFSDELNHASLIDGIRLSRARYHIYPHNNLEILEDLLKKTKGEKLIITESLFSMTGDFSPLRELSFLALKYNALLYVDEAHATGIFGKNFSGRVYDLNKREHIITLHTFSKALGSFGAFVSCNQTIKEYLINKCRSFIYTTAPPPWLMVQWMAALDVLKTEPERPLALRKKTLIFKKSLSNDFSLEINESPIVPISFPSRNLALKNTEILRKKGFQVVALRYPTVPQNKEGLRLILRYSHKEEELKCLQEALKNL